MGNKQIKKGRADDLTEFQKEKLNYDFYTYFDFNRDGCLTYKDFLWAKDKICQQSGWKIDSPNYKTTETLFKEIWRSLETIADVDQDGKITRDEWLKMWAVYKKEIIKQEKKGNPNFLKEFYHNAKTVDAAMDGNDPKCRDDGGNKDKVKKTVPNEQEESFQSSSDKELPLDGSAPQGEEEEIDTKPPVRELSNFELYAASKVSYLDDICLPKWLFKYLVYRFNLLDRTGDGVIDNEEFEYVLSEFGVGEKSSRTAFTMFTENGTIRLDFDYFVQLFEHYYLSDDPSDLGNFINGKLDWKGKCSDEEDPGLIDLRRESNVSVRSMDDDLRVTVKGKKETGVGSTIKLHLGKSDGEPSQLRVVIKKCCFG